MEISYLNFKKYVKRKLYGDGVDIILKSIEQQCGRLDPTLKKLSDEYALDVLGSLKHSKHLYIYCAIQNEFREGWIPESYYFSDVLPKKKGAYGELGELNGLQSILFGKSIFPDIVYSINGLLLSRDYESVSVTNFLNIAREGEEKIVFKSDNSGRGAGIKILSANEMSRSDLKSFGNGVFQKYISQHKFFKKFANTSVATIRLTTVMRSNSNSSLAGAYLRIGRITDLYVKSASAIKIPINSKTGQLHSKGYSPNWKYIYEHPDTGESFQSQQIPHFDKCVKLSLELHQKIPYVNCIGWDMIIGDNNEAIPIEWNGSNNDIKFMEATLGPCFKYMGWENLWKNG